MTSDAVLAILRAHEDSLRRQGVTRVALFGSIARGEGGPDSDLDIMVEIDPSTEIDLYDYVGITQYIADLFPATVDVSDRAMLIETVRETADQDAMYAF